MADMTFGSVGKIVDIALKIKEAVETVKQNQKECRDIHRCVARVTALIKRLDEVTETMKDDVMHDALEDLAESLEGALELVTKCQRKHVVRRFIGASDMAKELRQVQDDILRKVTIGTFATNVLQISITLTTVAQDVVVEDVGMEKLSHGSHPNVDSRCDKEKTKVATGSGVPFDPLSGLTKFSLSELEAATDKFSEKYKIGQGSYGVVFKGVLRNGLVVSIKQFHRIDGSDSTFLHEICNTGVKLLHKNVVETLGYCAEDQETCMMINGKSLMVMDCRRMLVMRYMPNGSLADTIIQGKHRIYWSTCFRIIEGIAQGLHYK